MGLSAASPLACVSDRPGTRRGVDIASVDPGTEKLDNHLRSRIPRGRQVPDGELLLHRRPPRRRGWVVDGELTLRGVTRPVPLAVAVIGFGVDRHGGQRAGFSATTRINRGDFGIDRWTGGGAVVSDKVPIDLEIEAVLQKRVDPDRPPATILKPRHGARSYAGRDQLDVRKIGAHT